MTAQRRLARIEGSLSPRQAVVIWLTEARAFPSLAAYASSTLDDRPGSMPLERIIERVERATRTAHRGERPTAIEAAVARSLEDAVFLYELVLGLHAARFALLGGLRPRLEAVRLGLEGFVAEAAPGEPGLDQTGPAAAARGRRWRAWRELVDDLSAAVEADDEARLMLERRYFDGHETCFAEVATNWHTLTAEVRELGAVADAIEPRVRARAARRRRPRPSSGATFPVTRAEQRASAIAAAARLAALELLGQDRRAAAFVSARLQGHPDGADPSLYVKALERLARPRGRTRATGPGLTGGDGREAGVAALAHPLDDLAPAEQARQLRLVLDELEGGS